MTAASGKSLSLRIASQVAAAERIAERTSAPTPDPKPSWISNPDSGSGGGAGTVTSTDWVAERPSGSVAVTVRVAVPADHAVRTRSLPSTRTRTTQGSDDDPA